MAKDSKKLDRYKREIRWALILLRHLNNNGYDYRIADLNIPDNFADVDVCAESRSSKYSPLYIQLCLDVEPRNEGYEKIPLGNIQAHTFNNCGN